jgi:NAD-dependent deacetylase sirtuin 2
LGLKSYFGHFILTIFFSKAKIFDDDVVPACDDCNSVVKPDIVFFGEGLPQKFFEHANDDFAECNLLIIMGTSLSVQPFASLVNR